MFGLLPPDRALVHLDLHNSDFLFILLHATDTSYYNPEAFENQSHKTDISAHSRHRSTTKMNHKPVKQLGNRKIVEDLKLRKTNEIKGEIGTSDESDITTNTSSNAVDSFTSSDGSGDEILKQKKRTNLKRKVQKSRKQIKKSERQSRTNVSIPFRGNSSCVRY